MTLDLRMPGMGGIAVLEAIKKVDPEIEVLIITGYGSFDTAIQGLRHRAFDYLVQALRLRRRSATWSRPRSRAAPPSAACATRRTSILAALSHEFRTPLNVIMGYSTMLGDEGDMPLSGEQRLALDRIQSNSSALLSYVETLFYMVELDRGLVPVQRTPVHLAKSSRTRPGRASPSWRRPRK